ncbi:MAG: TonB-dependent receptor, partial [Verrucomicrobiota bacterium]
NLSVDFVASDVAMSYDLADPQFPEITLADEYMSDASLYQFEDYSTRVRVGSETDQIGSVNVKWKNAFGHENALLRFGAKSRVRDRDRGNEVEFWDFGEEGSFTLTEVMADDGYLPFIEGRYATNIQADYASLRDGISQKADLFVYDERRSREQSDSSTNDVEEQVDAFYGMASVEVGKWRGIVGLRSEDTSISFNANEVLIDQDRYDADNDGDVDEFIYLETRPTYGENQYGNSFSNAHVRYRWNERTTVIASYTNTIDRPNYAEVVPYRRVDVEDREIEEGNPELRPTLYTNLDFSVDYKLGEGGMLSFELFDQAVDDVIFSRETVVSGGVYDGFELERRENNASAQIRGLSFTWNQPLYLAMLPGGLSFNANYVRQDTELVYPFRPDEVLPVTGRPDSRLKLALNYQTKKIFAQLKLATSDESIYRVGNSPEKDRFRRPRERMDLSVSYKLQDKTRFYVEWENLTNAPELDNYEGE